MFFRSSATPANPFDASSSSSSSPPRTANTATSIGNSSDSSLPTSSATTASLFTTPSRSSYYPSSSSSGRALPPPPPSSTNNESPVYQQHQQHHLHHPNNSTAGARTASNLADRSSRKNNVLHSYLTPSKAYHLSNSPFDLPSHTHTHATNSNSSKTPPPSSMATRFQQHQQSLMQKFQHYPSSGNQASNVTSSPQGAGPGPPHPHHNAFSPYGGPPGSPAGYPGFGLHSGPPGPPPGAVGSGPGHLQGGPSPGIHHSGNAGAGNGSGSFGPPSQSQGSGSRYGAPHIGGGGGVSGQNGPHSQMNGHHPHSQAHFHGQHMGGSNGPPGNQQAQIGMGSGSDDRSGINGQGQQQQQQQTDFKNSSSAHAQQQMEYAEVSRQSTSPHHHARAAHLQQRGMTASGNVAVGDPLRHPTMSIGRPNKDGKDKEHGRSDSLAADDIRPLTVTAIRKGANTARSTDTPPTINTAAYIEAEREKTGQAWSTIDMGGMHLRNLSAELFRYSFLTTLYVPHNNLTSLPPALSSLTHLVLLDVSGNKLSSVPPELGMLTNLRELLLFDNQLTNLPAELGTLYQLDLLGIEGNPLPDNLRQLVDKEGTQGLISYLRDSCPVPLPPADREWISVDADSFPSAADADLPEPETFSVFCYNVLCEKAATPQMYGYTPSWALSWDYRKELILQEILGYSADIICLQEVDGQQYEDFFLPNLSNNGYEGIYWPRTKARTMTAEEKKHVDGNATFYKPSTFSLVEQQLVEFNQIAMRRPDFKKTEDMFNRVMTKDNIAVIALLEHKESGARLICANTHIYWDNEFRDVKLVQVAMLMDELTKIANHFARLPPKHPSALGKGYEKAPAYSEGNKIPMVICGDFNSQKSSGVYEYLTNGTVDKNHDDFMHHVYGSYTSEGLAHRFALKSAYSHLDNNGGAGSLADGPIITNWTPTFKGCIDHIWHTTNSLGVTGLLGEVDPAYLSKVVGFPNAHFPSDHISILAEFKVKPQHSGNERQPEKAQFRLGGLGR